MAEECNVEAVAYARYLKGEGTINHNKYICLVEQYLEYRDKWLRVRPSLRPRITSLTLVQNHLVREQMKLWKHWQQCARDIEQQYKEGLEACAMRKEINGLSDKYATLGIASSTATINPVGSGTPIVVPPGGGSSGGGGSGTPIVVPPGGGSSGASSSTSSAAAIAQAAKNQKKILKACKNNLSVQLIKFFEKVIADTKIDNKQLVVKKEHVSPPWKTAKSFGNTPANGYGKQQVTIPRGTVLCDEVNGPNESLIALAVDKAKFCFDQYTTDKTKMQNLGIQAVITIKNLIQVRFNQEIGKIMARGGKRKKAKKKAVAKPVTPPASPPVSPRTLALLATPPVSPPARPLAASVTTRQNASVTTTYKIGQYEITAEKRNRTVTGEVNGAQEENGYTVYNDENAEQLDGTDTSLKRARNIKERASLGTLVTVITENKKIFFDDLLLALQTAKGLSLLPEYVLMKKNRSRDTRFQTNERFTLKDDRMTFKFRGEDIDIEWNGPPDVRYIIVIPNTGISLANLVTYCYDKVTLESDNKYTLDNLNLSHYMYDPFTVASQLRNGIDKLKKVGYHMTDIELQDLSLDVNGVLSLNNLGKIRPLPASTGSSGSGCDEVNSIEAVYGDTDSTYMIGCKERILDSIKGTPPKNIRKFEGKPEDLNDYDVLFRRWLNEHAPWLTFAALKQKLGEGMLLYYVPVDEGIDNIYKEAKRRRDPAKLNFNAICTVSQEELKFMLNDNTTVEKEVLILNDIAKEQGSIPAKLLFKYVLMEVDTNGEQVVITSPYSEKVGSTTMSERKAKFGTWGFRMIETAEEGKAVRGRTDPKMCDWGTNGCEVFNGTLALLNLGGKFDLWESYNLPSTPTLVTEWRSLLLGGRPVKAAKVYALIQRMFSGYEAAAIDLNLPPLFLRWILSEQWIPQHSTAEPSSLRELKNQNRITIEYDSMSEGDIEEIEKAMSMYSDGLEKYESVGYDSSSGVSDTSEQKASLYDSSSEASVTPEQETSLYDSSSEAEMSETSEQKASLYDSSSDAESSVKASLYDSSSDAGSSVKRVLYDSSSEVDSETEMDYSLHSDSESDVNMEGNVPYNSDSDMDTI